MANYEIVPGSAFTKGTAERRKSATSFSLPGFASRGTYSANFVIAATLLAELFKPISRARRFRWRSAPVIALSPIGRLARKEQVSPTDRNTGQGKILRQYLLSFRAADRSF